MKKKIFAVTAIVLLLAIAVVGTLAYFTDETPVAENVFTVGKVYLKLQEYELAEDGQTKGEKLMEEGKGNTYNLLPGEKYSKEPVVTVEGGSEDCYVRVLVTLHHADAFYKIYQNHNMTLDKALEFFGGFDNTKWVPVEMKSSNIENGNLTVEFRYFEVVEKSEEDTVLPSVITDITLPDWVTNQDVEDFVEIAGEAKFTVDIVAQAIQTSSNFADADAAWAAFEG